MTATLDALAWDAPDTVILGEARPRHPQLPHRPRGDRARRDRGGHLASPAAGAVRALPARRAAARRRARGRLDRRGRAHRRASRTSRGPRSARSGAAERYGCRVLREEVDDEPGNATRFVWLGAAGSEPRRVRRRGRVEDVGRLRRRRRRPARLARALPVGVRLPRGEPDQDRVAPAARAPRATTSSTSTWRAGPASRRWPTRCRRCTRTARRSGCWAPIQRHEPRG